MEITIKKTKITSSILNQITFASYKDIKEFSVIGWCVHQKHRWAVLQNLNSGELRKSIMVEKVLHINEFGTDKVQVIFVGNVNSIKYTGDDDRDLDEVFDVYERLKNQTIEMGQFYI